MDYPEGGTKFSSARFEASLPPLTPGSASAVLSPLLRRAGSPREPKSLIVSGDHAGGGGGGGGGAFEHGGLAKERRSADAGIDQVARWEDLIGPVSNLVLIIQGLSIGAATRRRWGARG